jgi:hypothetical protein
VISDMSIMGGNPNSRTSGRGLGASVSHWFTNDLVLSRHELHTHDREVLKPRINLGISGRFYIELLTSSSLLNICPYEVDINQTDESTRFNLTTNS